DDIDALSGGIDQDPVLVPLAGEVGTFIAAAHRDDDVGGGDGVVGELLWLFAGDVDADLVHGFYGHGVDLVAGHGAGGADVDFVAGEVGQEPGGHLGAACVVYADEQDARSIGFGHVDVLRSQRFRSRRRLVMRPWRSSRMSRT